MAALHEIASCSTYRVDDNFVVSEGCCKARVRPSYEKLERKRLEVGAVERDVCYATQGAVQIRREGGDTSVIFRRGALYTFVLAITA